MVATTALQQHLEKVEPEFSSFSSPYTLYRYDKSQDRYYFTFNENGTGRGYLSVTSFVKKSLGISDGLYKWATQLGAEAAKHYAQMRADYGTLLHIVIVELLKEGQGDYDAISQRALESANNQGYGYCATEWQSEIVKDVAAFMAFYKEKEVKVLAAEFPVCSKEYGLAGCIDLIVTMNFNRKRINAIVDIKSGRKGFWKEHELQLHTYKKLWNDDFSVPFPVTHVFNFAPTDWRKTPKYKLQNQTNSPFSGTVIKRMSIAQAESWVSPPIGHFEVRGHFSLENYELSDHLQFIEI